MNALYKHQRVFLRASRAHLYKCSLGRKMSQTGIVKKNETRFIANKFSAALMPTQTKVEEHVIIVKNCVGLHFLTRYFKLEILFYTIKHYYILFVHLVTYNSYLIEHTVCSAHMLTRRCMKEVHSEPY
jgi:hypothetical protein